MPASHAVNFTSTLVVCAPKMFSVTAPPNAAPKPSLFGRCIRITSTISSATSTKLARQRLIRIDIETENMAKREAEANLQRSTSKIELKEIRCWVLDVSIFGVYCLIAYQIASTSARSTSPRRLPCVYSLLGPRLVLRIEFRRSLEMFFGKLFHP